MVAVVVFAGMVAAPGAGASAVWSVVATPNPAGTTNMVLSGASCPNTRSCFVVGDYSAAAATETVVKHWNGSAWAVMVSPNVAGATHSVLEDASCPTASSCFAVGYSETVSTSKTLVEHWNGHDWGIMTSPDPSGSPDVDLYGVSCPSAGSCFAVGTWQRGPGYRTLVEHWNGHQWGIMASPNLSTSTEDGLTGVSCPSVRSCFAVSSATGSENTTTLVEHWNGRRWGIMASPSPPGAIDAGLRGVSCASVKICFAVGDSFDGSRETSLIYHWNGRSWAIVTSPDPAGSLVATFSSVSCPTIQSCFAVGQDITHSGTNTLVEHWNGYRWLVQASPNPPGATDSKLYGVTCPTTNLCTAVGYFDTGGPAASLVERYT